MRKTTAVIFDMDGVLADTEQIYCNTLRSVLHQYGYEVEEGYALSLCGRSVVEKLELLREDCHIREDIFAIAAVYRKRLEDFPDCSGLLFPNVKETLAVLVRAGCRLGLASNSNRKRIDKVLGDCGLTGYFSHISSGYALGATKPDPAVYLDAMDCMGVKPEECAAVEDSTSGILAAKAAGLFTVAKRDPRFGFDQRGADARMDDMAELPGILWGSAM